MAIGEQTRATGGVQVAWNGNNLESCASPAASSWKPKWIIPDNSGIGGIGLQVDDHCFVVLVKNQAGQWRPVKHMPIEIAKYIGNLVDAGVLKYKT